MRRMWRQARAAAGACPAAAFTPLTMRRINSTRWRELMPLMDVCSDIVSTKPFGREEGEGEGEGERGRERERGRVTRGRVKRGKKMKRVKRQKVKTDGATTPHLSLSLSNAAIKRHTQRAG